MMMESEDMDILQEFLHGDLEEDGEEEDYSQPPVNIGDGPPSERVRQRLTSSQSNYKHLKVNNYLSKRVCITP
jgi:hypothetical protein